jgi:class 3 adenylate cyclase
LICEVTGTPATVLDALAAPLVVHLCAADGRGDVSETDCETARARVLDFVAARRPAIAFAGLASPLEVACVELLLERGVQVHVVLPYEIRDLRSELAESGRSDAIGRVDRCVERAASVIAATSDGRLGDEVVFAYTVDLAMGLAALRARHIDAPVEQIVVMRGPLPPAASRWNALGRAQTVVSLGEPTAAGAMERAARVPESRADERVLRAMLFGDVKGFSKLPESKIRLFIREALGTLARALEPYDSNIRWRNTWGDGLYVVMDGVVSAACCALALQAALDPTRLVGAGLDGLGLRIGAHYGPVIEAEDPILQRTVYFGSHVNRTARIEPVTPVGSVYVTEQFAASLELENQAMICEYVGHLPSAKDYGAMRMYCLRSSV